MVLRGNIVFGQERAVCDAALQKNFISWSRNAVCRWGGLIVCKEKRKLQEVWDHLNGSGNGTLGDVADVQQGQLDEKDRPVGVCWACGKFAENSFIHEQPGTAGCCKGCDAYGK